MTLYILEYLTESYIHYFDLKCTYRHDYLLLDINFLGSETLMPLQYREHVKLLHNLCIHEILSLKVVTYSISDNIMS